MENERSFYCSLELTLCFCKNHATTPPCIRCPHNLFPWDFACKILYAFFLSSCMRLVLTIFFFLWLYSPILGLGCLHETFRFISVTRSRTVGRTPWTGDQLVARPLLTAPGWLWWWRSWWNERVFAGETEVLGDNLLRRHIVHHKSYLPDPDANPGRRGGKLETNRLSCGAALALLYDHS
jgi:hypothetical protein